MLNAHCGGGLHLPSPFSLIEGLRHRMLVMAGLDPAIHPMSIGSGLVR